MTILAIETSCDETAAAVTEGRRMLSNVVFSQVDIHRQWGGVYPSLAKRAHEERIDLVIERALKNARLRTPSRSPFGHLEGDIEAIAVTFGPGLVIALEVGIRKAKELAEKWQKPLIPVDHTEGHIYSSFVQNRNGRPKREFNFPFLVLVVSGGHTSLVLARGHLQYEILGKTLDDAAGEALDKAAKVLGMAYPGGPVIEKLAEKGNPDFLDLPIPMKGTQTLDFSYSGLKTAFKRKLEKMSSRQVTRRLSDLAASFQQAAFAQLMDRLERAIEKTKIKHLVAGGGVISNKKLRRMIRKLAKEKGIKVYFPHDKRLFTDNAAMIGVAGHYKYKKGIYLKNDFSRLDRVARPDLKMWTEAPQDSKIDAKSPCSVDRVLGIVESKRAVSKKGYKKAVIKGVVEKFKMKKYENSESKNQK